MLTNPRFWLKHFGEIKSNEVEKHKWCLAEFREPMHVPRNFYQHKNQRNKQPHLRFMSFAHIQIPVLSKCVFTTLTIC